jgi:hypothetical protein
MITLARETKIVGYKQTGYPQLAWVIAGKISLILISDNLINNLIFK